MPEARIIKFPARAPSPAHAKDARAVAEAFFTLAMDRRSTADWASLSDGDVASAFLDLLGASANSDPVRVSVEAESAYARISASDFRMGLFDERDYFLGELALLGGNTARVTGHFERADGWFDLADASFRQTIDPYPPSIRVAHARLLVRYELRRFSDVLALIPGVISSFERREMFNDLAKARFLQAVTYKEIGDFDRMFECLLGLRETAPEDQITLRSFVLTNLAEECGRRGDHGRALTTYEEALSLTDPDRDPMAYAQLTASVGDTYRAKGDYARAINCFRSAIAAHAKLGMETRVASLRILTAETLLTIGRDREAEWEILAALPTIEEQKMVAEGFAATGLLKESVRRRRTDAGALSELSLAIKSR